MKKIYALAAALALGFSLPAFAQTAPAPDAKVQADVKKPEHAKEKSSEAKKPEHVVRHPAAREGAKVKTGVKTEAKTGTTSEINK
jgi:uncharacterized low-complexity protein